MLVRFLKTRELNFYCRNSVMPEIEKKYGDAVEFLRTLGYEVQESIGENYFCQRK